MRPGGFCRNKENQQAPTTTCSVLRRTKILIATEPDEVLSRVVSFRQREQRDDWRRFADIAQRTLVKPNWRADARRWRGCWTFIFSTRSDEVKLGLAGAGFESSQFIPQPFNLLERISNGREIFQPLLRGIKNLFSQTLLHIF